MLAYCFISTLVWIYHKNHILHRDIKPENLVFDEQGYLRITDLGIARIFCLYALMVLFLHALVVL